MGNLLCRGLTAPIALAISPHPVGPDVADCLPAIVDVDVFDRDLLLVIATMAIERPRSSYLRLSFIP